MPDINIIGMENMKQLCGWLVVAVLMATAPACRGGKAAETVGAVVIDTMTTAEIDSLPEEVEGAGCAYYRTPVITNGVISQTDIIFISAHPYAAMKLDGKKQLLEMVDSISNFDRQVFANQAYKVTVSVQHTKHWPGDEEAGGGLEDGELKVEKHDGRHVRLRYYGYCGC